MTGLSPDRRCPVCGLRTGAVRCPDDGTATVSIAPNESRVVLPPGHVIDGRYRIDDVVGKGGFCTVYAAEHTGTGQAVAIKVLDRLSDSDDGSRRFHREARATASLRHPNTVRVFDVGETHNGALYLAMELLRGGTLEAEIARRRTAGAVLGEAEAIEVGLQVLGSLEEAHARGLVHRDLKPGNIAVCTPEDVGVGSSVEAALTIKVLDFGIAREHGSNLTDDHKTLGTPAYMSPEQCQGLPVDGRSDLYALGAVLWECVCGERLFADGNSMSVMFQHAYHEHPPLQRAARTPLSAAFIATVERALKKHPRERFASAAEMRRSLQQVAAVQSVATSGPLDAIAAPTSRGPSSTRLRPSSSTMPRHEGLRASSAAIPAVLSEEDDSDQAAVRMILFVGVLLSILGVVAFLLGEITDDEVAPAPAALVAPDANP